jgi:hypothetical protein
VGGIIGIVHKTERWEKVPVERIRGSKIEDR